MSLARESTLSKRLRPEHPARQDCSSITSRVQQHCSMDDHWAIKTRASAEPHSCHELRRVHATEGTPSCRSKCDSPSALQAGAAAGAVGGAVGGAAPVLLVVPLPVPLSRYSEPSGDGPAGRRLPSGLRPAAVAHPGLAWPRARDISEPSGARENFERFSGSGRFSTRIPPNGTPSADSKSARDFQTRSACETARRPEKYVHRARGQSFALGRHKTGFP